MKGIEKTELNSYLQEDIWREGSDQDIHVFLKFEIFLKEF